MKKLFKNILVLAVLLGTYTSYANATSDLISNFNNANKGDIISVTDASGEVIYSGEIKYNGNIKNLFDFSQLKDGTYAVEVNKDFEIDINTIVVKNNNVTFITSSNEKIFKPVIRAKDSRLMISKLSFDPKDTKVEIYYEDELIHSETVKGNEVLKRVYKLDHTLNGDYTAIIRANDRVFVENFKL